MTTVTGPAGPMIETRGPAPDVQDAARARSRPSAASTSTVGAGEIFGFLGPNGAGKTTTLRMLATLLDADAAGRRPSPASTCAREPQEVRRRIGYVPQGGSTDPGRDRPRRARPPGPPVRHGQGRPPSAVPREVLEALDLSAAADRPTATYSGGMRRRLDVGLGIVHRPAVLFLDEPTTGLDPQARARMWDEIRALREQGTTVFLTTHYLEEADALADRLAIIDHGLIVAEGTARRAEAPGRRRRHHARRRRRPGARPRDRPRPAVRPRGIRRGRASSACTSTRATAPSPSSSGSSTAPTFAPRR